MVSGHYVATDLNTTIGANYTISISAKVKTFCARPLGSLNDRVLMDRVENGRNG